MRRFQSNSPARTRNEGAQKSKLDVMYLDGLRKAGTARKKWSGLSESNRHLNLGKVREIKSNALERRHLAFLGNGLNRKMMENKSRVVSFNFS